MKMRNVTLSVLSGMFFLAMFLAPVFASPVDMKLIDPVSGNHYSLVNPLITCPRPITYPQDIRIFITNLGAQADTYILSLKVPDGWEGQIESNIMLAAGQQKELNLFLINQPYPWRVQPGIYEAEITVQSNTNPADKISKKLPIQILACHGVEVVPEQGYKETCEENPVTQYKITVTNKGKQKETFELHAQQNGEDVTWAEFSNPVIALNPDESKDVNLTLRPYGENGVIDLDVVASSRDSWAQASAKIQLKLNNCYDFEMELQPKEQNVCYGKPADFKLRIANLGRKTTIRISLPERMLDVNIAENGSTEVPIHMTTLPRGETKLDISAYSLDEQENKKNVRGKILVEECRKVSMTITPEQRTVCINDSARFDITIENQGSARDSFDFHASMGTYDYQKIELEPGAKLTFTLFVDMKGKPAGEYEIDLIASNSATNSTKKAKVSVEKCWDVDVDIQPKSLTICACSELTFIATVINTGKYQDGYIIEFGNQRKNFVLKPNQTEQFNLSYAVPCSSSGKVTIPVIVKSAKTEDVEKVELNIQAKDRCWAVQVEAKQPVNVEQYKAVTIPIKVKNLGSEADEYTIELIGPVWLDVQPKNMSLESGSEDVIYVYASPNESVEPKKYSAQVKISSKYVTSFAPFDISVYRPGEAPQTQEWSVTGLVTAFMAPLWKIAIVGVIALGIIMVLVIKLAFYLRPKPF
ncbi:MAG: hypothetical protein QW561_02820 [Candidatus Aenigmatarchaeota archaeon]